MRKAIACVVLCASLVSGCATANEVSYKIARDADWFKVSRRITVINTRQSKPVYENQGLISVNVSVDRLDVIKKESNTVYTKDIVVLNRDTMYVIEDLEGTEIGKEDGDE